MTTEDKLEKIKKLADDMYYAAAYLGPNVGSGERLRKTMEEYHKFIIHEYNKEEPKFKVGDYIKPVDSCLGSPRTIVEVCDSWYVTNQGTIDFEYEDNWELVEKCKYAQKQADWLQELHCKLDSLSKEDLEKVWAKYHQKEEPVSEDLEIAAQQNSDKYDVEDILDKPYHHVDDAFKAGAKWQKQQFEKNRLKLTCDDISKIRQIMFDYNRQLRLEIVENKASLPKDEEYCREVLNRFKKGKG